MDKNINEMSVSIICDLCSFKAKNLRNMRYHKCEPFKVRYEREVEKNNIYLEILKSFKIPNEEEEEEEEEEESKKIKKKRNFRNIKNVEVHEEKNQDDVIEIIENVNTEISTIKHSFGDIDSINIEIDRLFSTLRESRVFNPIFTDIKNIRKTLICILTLDDYINVLHSHVVKIEEFLQSRNRKKDSKQITTNAFTGLELRLIKYHNYHNTSVEIDDISLLKKSLLTTIDHPESYSVFGDNNIVNSMMNYGVALIPFRKILDSILINRYGLYNYIYLDIEHSKDDDPYSFYKLSEITASNRKWVMDVRTINMSEKITSTCLPYMVNLFRDIYKSLYRDNQYRDLLFTTDVGTKPSIIECDCTQLISNILSIHSIYSCSLLVRDIIKKKCTYKLNKNDKFDLTGDDKLQRKKFEEYKKSDDPAETIKRLFDDITSKQSVEICDFFQT